MAQLEYGARSTLIGRFSAGGCGRVPRSLQRDIDIDSVSACEREIDIDKPLTSISHLHHIL